MKSYRPGQVLKRRKGLFLTHKGIYTGKGTVIDATPENGVAERSLVEFADGQQVKDGGYPGNLSLETVLARAEGMIGAPYSYTGDNCEHLVTSVHGLKKESPQLQTLAAVGLFVLAFVVVNKALRT